MPKKTAHNGAEPRARHEAGGMITSLRKIVLASVGVVGVAQDELIGFVNRLVERGEITEKDARQLIAEVRREIVKHRKAPELRVEKQLEALLEKMNIPSKADIEDLNTQVAQLTRRIEELKADLNKM